jgi:nitroreductase
MQINELIKKRRAIFPKTYLPDRPIDRAIIEQLLENARWAPTHKLTQPWRFKVFHSQESRARLSKFMATYYVETTPADQYSEEKVRNIMLNPLRSGAVMAICLHRDPKESLPEWEEIAAVSAAVQNMWLTCTELGLGCYWSTPPNINHVNDFLELDDNERCIGWFYMGWHEMPALEGKRHEVDHFATWM